MTISSVPAGAAIVGPRQLKLVGNLDLAKQDPTLKLETGAWSTISWEFNSVLRALLPDATEEPVSSGPGGDKAASGDAGTSQAAEPPESAGLPNAGKTIATDLSSDSLGILKNTVNSWQGPSQNLWHPAMNIGLAKGDQSIAVVAIAAGPKLDSVAPPQDPAPGTSSPLRPQTPPYVRIVPRVNVPTRPLVDPKSDAIQVEGKATTPDIVAVLRPTASPLNNFSDSKPKDPVGVNVPANENESETKLVPPAPVLIRTNVSTLAVAVPISHPGTWQLAAQQKAVIRSIGGGPAPRPSVRTADVLPKSGLELPTGTEKPVATETAPQTISTQAPSDVAPPLTANVIPIPEVASVATPTGVDRIERTVGTQISAPPTPVEQRLKAIDSEPAPRTSDESLDQPLAPMLTVVSSQPLPRIDAEDLKPLQREKLPLRSPSPNVHAIPSVVARTPEKPDEEQAQPNPAGLFSIPGTKVTSLSTTETQGPPPPPLGKPAAAAEPFAIPESTSKGDKPSSNDSVVAFTGRLTPKSDTKELAPPSVPDHSIEAKQEKPLVSAAREIQEVPADRPVHSTADVAHDHPIVRNDSAVFSDVARDLAPASPNQPPEAAPTARSAFGELAHEPASRETSGPIREISMRFTDAAQDSAHLHVVEKGGEVLVSVRSGSEQLARTLSSDLGELSHRLEQTGFQTELYRPGAQSSNSETGHEHRDGNASDSGQNANQSWSRERRDSQQHSGQGGQEWIEDFEESMGLS